MRRSCAPSMRQEVHRQRIEQIFNSENNENEVGSTTIGAAITRLEATTGGQFWGTRGNEYNEDTVGSKLRLFNVVWREISCKKHKTWQGDGTLEVQLRELRAVLRDDTGKYLGATTAITMDELKEGQQLTVGGKETELLEEVKDRAEYLAGKRLRVAKSVQQEQRTIQSSVLTGKALYYVVWREVSNKKHKTWQGDGVFEVHLQEKRAVLKDDKGKYMGTTNLKGYELKEGLQLMVAGKEIELLEEIKEQSEYWALRRQQAENRGWGEEEWAAVEAEPAEKKSKGSYYFRASLGTLAMPEQQKRPKNGTLSKEEDKTDSTVNVARERAVSAPFPSSSNTFKSSAEIEMQVSPKLSCHLRPHQHEGVAFLYACLMGYKQPNRFGCILADEMGLGKTLQCLTVAHTMLQPGTCGGARALQRLLIVTPSSLTANWENEVGKWLKSERMYAFVVDAKHKLNFYARQQHIPFIIVSYETLLARLVEFQQMTFDLLICDEGHRLKNRDTKIYAALRELNILRRVILSGTPVQNDLQEFFALADFVNPGVFGVQQEFHTHFELPIQRAQSPEASKKVKQLAAARSAELNEISGKFLLRRLQQLNREYLPRKHEYICFVRPSELQKLLLKKALDLYKNRKDTILKDLNPLQIITVLKKICNHPSLIGRTKSPNLFTRNLERFLPDWTDMGPFDSAKLELMQHFLIAVAVQKREKCVLVSNHTKTLNMLQGLCDHLQLKCLRLDGSTPNSERNANVEQFNLQTVSSEQVPLVFLLSAKAGGMGLNLTGASRLVLFDNDWNPATDAQAISRIWRDGQRSDVQTYRLITAGTIEEKIFQRQLAKMSLGDCVMQAYRKADDVTKLSANELLDLFTLQEDFDCCQTHETLNCNCQGDGKNVLKDEVSHEGGNQLNELMKWEHYQPPFDKAFLEAAGLHNASDIVYIFSNQTDLA